MIEPHGPTLIPEHPIDDPQQYGPPLSPEDPIDDPQHLVGRAREFAKLSLYITGSGAQPFVTGDRGIGKTSMVVCVLKTLEDQLTIVRVGCGRETCLASILREISDPVDIGVRGLVLPPPSTVLGSTGTPRTQAAPDPAPLHDDLFRGLVRLRGLGRPVVLHLDEIDQIQERACLDGLAQLVKQCSDSWRRHGVTVVMSGIQAQVTRFFMSHRSIERCAREIYLRPLEVSELRKIVTRAAADLHVDFPDAIVDVIATGAMGYPAFVHLVAHECIQETERRGGRREITAIVYEQAMANAREHAFRALSGRLDSYLSNPSSPEHVVLAHLAPTRQHFTNVDLLVQDVVRETGCSAEKAQTAIKEMARADGPLRYMSETRSVGFRVPLLKPFIQSRIRPARRVALASSQARLDLR